MIIHSTKNQEYVEDKWYIPWDVPFIISLMFLTLVSIYDDYIIGKIYAGDESYLNYLLYMFIMIAFSCSIPRINHSINNLRSKVSAQKYKYNVNFQQLIIIFSGIAIIAFQSFIL